MDFETHISLADYKTQISIRILDKVLFSFFYFRSGLKIIHMYIEKKKLICKGKKLN